MQHPMRDIPVTVFQRIEGEGPSYIAKFEPFKEYPIFFVGDTADDARMSARHFAEDAVAKNEQKFLTRKAALDKSRERKKGEKKVAVT